ncbi:uncharacterized protein [Linepithema humile]|uniref:uncharacterized protein n=1 Tax=Linepithema humile TaxID=83485 RepID=UPI00351F27BB
MLFAKNDREWVVSIPLSTGATTSSKRRNTTHHLLRRYFHYYNFNFSFLIKFIVDYSVIINKTCARFLAQCRRNDTFPDFILWTDETTFTPNGVFNSQNFLIWQEANPHAIRQCAFQYRWTINVWASVIANKVIGPYFLPPRLNGQTYAQFIENELPILLEDIPLQTRLRLIYQHDGAPAHYSRRTREILDARYPDRWIGRGGPINWPARLPDLNVLDYFIWGYIKAAVEHCRNGTEDEVREAIIAAFNTITPDIAHRATRQIVRRADLCLQARERHFEQLLN